MNRVARLLIGLPLGALLGAGGLALLRHGFYGWTVFILFPVVLGALASWTLEPPDSRSAVCLGALVATTASGLLLFFGIEGVLCIAMCLPLAIPLGMMGAWLEYQCESSEHPAHFAVLLLLPPSTVAWDVKAPQPLFQVHTAILVAAPPEIVWHRVLAFSELPDPEQWIFRAGIAYPQRAQIEGSGPGAVRYCEFSTGPFVEPIEVWDAPRLLRFRVTQNPPPMHEWSPYAQVLPKHLHGYFVSKQGQFQLTRLPDGRTLLEGTTWYQHGLLPAQYWRLWSDAIIHRIHLRVLNHIRNLAEHDVTSSASARTESLPPAAPAARPAEASTAAPGPPDTRGSGR
jgi:hypothetical protein